jgi:hypothetical protein
MRRAPLGTLYRILMRRPTARRGVVGAASQCPMFALVLLLAGCEVSSPVVSAGKDIYFVSSHVGACINCSAAVQSLKTANAFCAKQGKTAVIRNTSGYRNPFGYDNSNQLYFSCVSPH